MTTTAKARPRASGRKRKTPDSPVYPEAAHGIVTAEQVAKLGAAGLVIERAGVIGALRRDLRAAQEAAIAHPKPKCDGSCMPHLDAIAELVGEGEGGIWSTMGEIVEAVRRVAGEAADVEHLRAEIRRLEERVSFWELSSDAARLRAELAPHKRVEEAARDVRRFLDDRALCGDCPLCGVVAHEEPARHDEGTLCDVLCRALHALEARRG